MAKKAVKEEKGGVSAAELLAAHQKTHGDKVGSFKGQLTDTVRIPTGVFAFDMATGGGFPRGKCSIVYGPESSGKTNLCLLAIANIQRMFPGIVVFVNVEHSWDPTWAAKLGVDVSRVLVLEPDYAEQAADMVSDYMGAEDVILVVVDSLAMLMTMNQTESSAEKANVGGVSNPVQKMVQMTTQRFRDAEKEERMAPTLIYVNQVRSEIGKMFGNPEKMPGGNAPRFQSALTVRVYGINEMDNKISQVLPTYKDTKFVLKKWKVPIIAAGGEYKMCMIKGHPYLKEGQCNDWALIQDYLEELGEFKKHPEKKSGYIMLDSEYPTQAAAKAAVMEDWEFGMKVRTAIIEEYLGKHGVESGEA